MLSENPEEVLARVRRVCLQFAGATEKISHGAPAFEVELKHVPGRLKTAEVIRYVLNHRVV